MAESPTLNPDLWVDRHADVLFRFALARVRNPTVAEELTQETLVSAFKSRTSFKGGSSEQTWLVGILKHKILDHYRAQHRPDAAQELFSTEELDPFENSFDQERHLIINPKNWRDNPEKSAQTSALRDALERCLGRLPERLAKLFILREVDGVGTEELCKVFGVTPTNVWTTLHRVRHQLRNCLEKSGFQDGRHD